MTTIILVLLAIYIICIKNNTQKTNEEKNIKKININRNIIIGISEFDTLDPITTKSIEVQYISKLIYKPLIEITQDFNVAEGLAKEWSKTGTTEYIIKLNDAKWHNGSIVTARDVEFTINAIKESDSIYKKNVEKINSIDIIDNKTIKLKLTEETAFFEYLLCFPIVKENTYNNENIGTGSYKVEELQKDKVVLSNEDRKITIKIYNSVSEMYSEFSKEKIDFIITGNNEYSEHIRNIGVLEQIITGRNFYYMSFNNKKLEKEARKQIRNLINREQIIYMLYNNKYVITDFPLGYGSYLNSTMEKEKEKNIELPKQLILGIRQDEDLYKIAEQIKKQLKEENIEVSITYYYDLESALENNYYDLILNKKSVEITPKIDFYFQEEFKNRIISIYNIENKEILKKEYSKIIKECEEELPFMGLFFNSYIVLHNVKLKGDFSGNWYNPFYNIDTWYKVE